MRPDDGQEYVAIRFSRGAGLGNRLFPWGRAIYFARTHNCKILSPFWPRWTTTGLIRGGIDHKNFLRQISLVGIFRSAPDYVKGLDRMTILVRAKRIAETHPIQEDKIRCKNNEIRLRVFSGEQGQFEPLNGKNLVLRRELEAIVRPKWHALATTYRNFVVGINIRRGKDFRDATSEEDYIKKGGIRTPIKFFVETLRYVRSFLGQQVPALLVSDGTERELLPVLNERAVHILRPGCAASDLLALAYSRVLIGSGGSSFSAWASYLARCPTVTIRGQSLRWFSLDHGREVFVGDFHPDIPPPLFEQNLIELKQALRSE